MSNQQLNPPNDNQLNIDIQNNNPLMSSVPSFQSINSFNAQPVRAEDEAEAVDLQIVQSKSNKRINHEQVLRIYREQLQKQERDREQMEMRRAESIKNKQKIVQKPNIKKPSNQQRKVKQVSNERLLALTQKSNRIKKRIQDYCKQYKSMYRPSIYDTRMQKYRFQCKQKLFFYLCFGFQEIKQRPRQELPAAEQQLFDKNCYDVCRRLAFQIDLQMVKILNKNDKFQISREYKQQFETLLNNIKDQNNNQLKRKIILKTLTPSRIAVANQIQFFTTAKREEILQKQKRYIAQFTVENVLKPFNQNDNQEIITERPVEYEAPKEEVIQLKPQKSGVINKYIEQSSIIQLEELLSENQLNKMLKRLQEDLQGKSRTILINNFKEVFGV